MSKVVIASLIASILLVGCNQNSVKKTDQAVESVDAKVEKFSKSPNVLQPAAKSVDATVDAVHSTVHTQDSSAKSK